MDTDHICTTRWQRPELDLSIGITRPIIIQVMDVECFRGRHTDNNCIDSNLKLYGVTKEGNSVCLIVDDYLPHFYFEPPPGFNENHIGIAQRAINLSISKTRNTVICHDDRVNYVSLEMVTAESIYNFKLESGNRPFVKVSGSTDSLNSAMHELTDGVKLTGKGYMNVGTLYEADLDSKVQFMAKINLTGCGWIEISPDNSDIVQWEQHTSHCQLEARIKVGFITVHPSEGEWILKAPIRTLSFDIECLGRQNVFPQPIRDSVIQISNILKIEGETITTLYNCFVLNKCAPVSDVEIYECESEIELLERWSTFIREVDPDVITGYNIMNFDLPYILERAKTLQIPRVCSIGRQLDYACDVTQRSNADRNTFFAKSVSISGRIIFDTFQVIYQHFNLSSYTLNNVAMHFLNDGKEKVDHVEIPSLQNGNNESRRRLAIYCIKDAELPLRLIDHLDLFSNYVELARACGLTINYLLTRNTKLKILSIILRKCRNTKFILPTFTSTGKRCEIVTFPQRAFYSNHGMDLNLKHRFALVISEHNLCYSTLLKSTVGMTSIDYIKPSENYAFVTSIKRRGILPEIIEELLLKRDETKNMISSENEHREKTRLRSRHLALTMLSNLFYDFINDTEKGFMPCKELHHAIVEFAYRRHHS